MNEIKGKWSPRSINQGCLDHLMGNKTYKRNFYYTVVVGH